MPDAVTCATSVATRDSVVGLSAGGAAGAIGAGVGTEAGTGGASAGVVVVLVVETGVARGAVARAAVEFRPVAPTSAFVWCERPATTGPLLITKTAGEDLGFEPRPAEVPPAAAAATRPVAASATARIPTEDRWTSLIQVVPA
jgi:hypothetical protein